MASENVTKEIRLAVVLYGGTSLAIYINGVAQELFKMVRATSGTDSDLTPSEQVYKQIAKALGIKFVVDVLSGTSAGGINAVYLAKALVRNQKMDGIQKIWIEEGDIGKLINDSQSNHDLPPTLRKTLNAKPKISLLNGQRMYYKLLDALDGMDFPQKASAPGKDTVPLVQELDLFITATDLNGFITPIRLSNTVVNENRYRSVFRFRYAELGDTGEKEYDDFKVEDNPYLAFAARCTSSLPFVFETMTLNTIRDVLKYSRLNKYEQYLSDKNVKWKNYFFDYARRNIEFSAFQERAFGDGGYLDNKPFSYAATTILNRRTVVPVDRKLIYVEPVAEHPDEQAHNIVPDPLEHLMLALSSLPRTEPINDDIQFIKQRNRIIERVRNYQKYAIEGLVSQSKNKDAVDALWKTWRSTNRMSTKWYDMDLNDSVKKYGFTYYNYHHVRVALTTDHLGELVTRALGLDEDSEHLVAVRMLVQAWREDNFKANPQPSSGLDGKRMQVESENNFMYQMDMEYRIRRLRFMLNLIDALASFDGNADPVAGTDSDKSSAILKAAGYKFPVNKKTAKGRKPAREKQFPLKVFRQDLGALRKYISKILYKLLYYGHDVHEATPISKHIQFADKKQQEEIVRLRREMNTPRLSEDDLKAALSLSLDTTLNRERRRGLLAERVTNWNEFEMYFERLRNLVHKILRGVSAEAVALFENKPRSIAYRCLKFYYEHYDYFDVMTLPLIAGTSAEEADVIDIIRINPEDASSRLNKGIDKRTKLKGSMFGNFGGFFATDWRREDILWGQLDAAETIIRSLRDEVRELLKKESGTVPDEQIDKWLEEKVDKAQAAILRQNFFQSDSTLPMIKDAYTKAALKVMEDLSKKTSESMPALNEKVIPFMLDQMLADDKFILDLFIRTPKSGKDLPADVTMTNATRTVQVIGKVLQELSEKYSVLSKPGAWLSRLGLMAWSVVEFSLPNKLLNVLFHYWVGLFYLAEALVIVLGWIFGKPEIINIGWIAAGITAFIHLVTVILKEVFTRQNRK